MDSVQYRDNMSSVACAVKRLFDIALALLLLLLLWPVALVVAVMLRLEVNEPVLFKQERIGKGGRPFMICKFRTMHNDSEENGVPMLATGNDSRLTPLGRKLRAHHIDELPQLWNVLVGDMSFVGYRPERQYYIDRIMLHNPAYASLYEIRPGVTSLATLYNGYTDTMDKMLRRLEMDLDYLQHRTLMLDVRIIVLTAWFTLSGKRF